MKGGWKETRGVQRPISAETPVSESRMASLNPFETKRKKAPSGTSSRVCNVQVAEGSQTPISLSSSTGLSTPCKGATIWTLRTELRRSQHGQNSGEAPRQSDNRWGTLWGMSPGEDRNCLKNQYYPKEKWQPVGESNPSFQVENLAS